MQETEKEGILEVSPEKNKSKLMLFIIIGIIAVGSECNGTIMSASENVTVSGLVLDRGNLTNGEAQTAIYYCMVTVPSNIPSGTYDTTTAGSWTIKLFLAAFAIAAGKSKKRKKKIELFT